MLDHLLHELLDHCLPMPDLPGVYWYVLNPFESWCGMLDNTANVATGIGYIYQEASVTMESATVVNLATPYLTISLSLNMLLTLMIITRLILHRRDLRNAIGPSGGSSGLYIAVVAMIVESYALYAIGLLVQIILWARDSSDLVIISRAIGVVQVCGVSTLLRCFTTLGCRRLIAILYRSSLPISSFSESPSGEH